MPITQRPTRQHTEERTAAPFVCSACGVAYAIEEYLEHNAQYFEFPYDYESGCRQYCLACWLGVGTLDLTKESAELPADVDPRPGWPPLAGRSAEPADLGFATGGTADER